MNERARTWVGNHSHRAQDFSLERLVRAKGDHRISVVIPAHNEGSTVGAIVRAIRAELMDGQPLVDELLVMDSDSTDDTAAVARSAGAVVHSAEAVAREFGWMPGKGEAMWKALFVSDGDIVVFIDGDLTSFTSQYVMGLLGPLLDDGRIALVKGFYDRDLGIESSGIGQGGRVTELMARPLISLWWPELAGVIQPLAGEWAVRRAFLERIPVPTGYGVECAVLIDAYRLLGLDAIAQVDLGQRSHTHQDLASLGVMSAEVLAAAEFRRFPEASSHSETISHPDKVAGGPLPSWTTRVINARERPPFISIQQVDQA